MGDYVIAHTGDKKIVTKEKISNLSQTLSPGLFIQIHRSFIVSISKIEAVGPGFVEINKKKLPVGRNYKPQLNNLIQKNDYKSIISHISKANLPSTIKVE